MPLAPGTQSICAGTGKGLCKSPSGRAAIFSAERLETLRPHIASVSVRCDTLAACSRASRVPFGKAVINADRALYFPSSRIPAAPAGYKIPEYGRAEGLLT